MQRLAKLPFSAMRRMASTAEAQAHNEITLTFGSPATTFYSQKIVKQVDIPGLFAFSGIVKDHVPFITALRPGIVQVTEEDGNAKKYFVSSGTATFNADSSMQILAEEACIPEALDPNAISRGLKSSHDQLAAATDELERAEVQIAVEAYEALAKAAEEK